MGYYNRRRKRKTYTREGQRLRSGFEARVWDNLRERAIDFEYEPKARKIPYIVPESKHKYNPDFYIPQSNIFIEVKGVLDSADRKKHLLIKQQHGDKFDIRFCFWRLATPIYPGSKTTVQKWSDDNGFLYCERVIPSLWFEPHTVSDAIEMENLKLMRANMTQEEFVKAYLESGKSLSPAKAMAEFNITRLAAVVHSIKKKHGLNIVKTMKRSFGERNYAEYHLV